MTIKSLRARLATAPTSTATNGANAVPHNAYIPIEGMRETDTIVAPAFPVEVLPEKHRAIVDDLNRYLSYPKDFSAVGMLAGASIAIGRTHIIHNGIWEEGCCMYLALVAPPGTMKSHPLEFGLYPCIEANKRYMREYQRQKNLVMAAGQGSDPVSRQFIYGDFTIETLTRGLKRNPRGLAVYLDELKAWVQNFNRYNAGSEAEFWLMNWSGKTIALNRSNYQAVLERTDINVVGTIQPGLLEDIGKGGRALSGFIERILFCYPDEVPVVPFKKRRDRQSDTFHVIQARYIPLVQRLLDHRMLTDGIEVDETEEKRHLVTFQEDAEDELMDYLNDLKKRMNGIDNEYQRNIYSKMQSYCCRFSLLLYLMHEAAGENEDSNTFPPEPFSTVSSKIVRKAKALTEYFLMHSLKAQAQINSATPLDRLPRNLRNWYRDIPSGVEVSTSDIERIAQKHDISRATVFNYLGATDPNRKIFIRTRQGYYEKLYHA